MHRHGHTQRRANTVTGSLAALVVCAGTATAIAQPSEVTDLRRQLQQYEEMTRQLSERLTALEQRPSAPSGDSAVAARLDELEEIVFDIDGRVGSRTVVHAFDAMELDIGGLITQTFTAAFGGGESTASFNQTQFELFIKAKVNENWDIFLAQGFLREADLDVRDPDNPMFAPNALRVPQIIAWTNYRVNDSLQFQLGRFITPHGIINIEHFPPTLLNLNQPQFLRPFSGSTIFPNFLIGGQVHGRIYVGANDSSMLTYNAYVGALPQASSDFVFGGRIAMRIADSGFTIGGNYSGGQRRAGGAGFGNISIVGSNSLTSNSYHTVGADVLYDKGRILWKNEFFYSFEGDGAEDRVAFYTQPAYRITDKWIAFYRFDYLDPGQGLPWGYENVFGVNYLPTPTVRLRAELIFKHIDRPSDDIIVAQFSATISF